VVFSSHLFVYYFLPAVLAVYYATPRRARHLWLTLASYFFYGWANPAFMGLMLLSTAVDYACGLRIGALPPEAASRRRAWLVASLASNLSLLGFFKYFNFAASSYDGLVTALGLDGLRLDLALRVTLPLGISFYTFQSMSYTLDVYRGLARPLRNPVDMACFVALFPQLVAGPILRFSQVADQLRERTHSLEKFARGVAFFSLGMAKKVLLANPCGFLADAAFDASSLHALDAWTGVLAYAFQIYFDFSGYSDMAIGLGLMFGFVFPKNFDSPYRARSLTDFWRRWHISLSTWLRDYVFLKLSFVLSRRIDGVRWLGVREDLWVYSAASLITMLLAGLWHGAAWHFVVWGGLHGLVLVLERFRSRRSVYNRLPAPLRVGWTFLLVLVTWVFFRAADLPSALRYLSAMLGLTEPRPAAALLGSILYTPYSLLSLAVAAAVTWGAPQTWDWTQRLTWPRAAVALACLALALVAMASQGYNPFIYFIF
jgi:alginate O-acetyltransferase complex protein AlgI